MKHTLEERVVVLETEYVFLKDNQSEIRNDVRAGRKLLVLVLLSTVGTLALVILEMMMLSN